MMLPVLAYIGPGAGFAVLGSFLILFVAVLLAVLSLLSFPIRFTIGALLRRRKRGKGTAKRVVLLGLDGLDPERTHALMAKGLLPNFSKLAETGTFSKLRTTSPPMSPVAWSSFATGVNPGKHNIFDFLNRDLKTYMPQLSSCRIGSGRRPEIALLRKSSPFWRILGEHGVFSTILRVPITFPPEKFRGLSLSAMCTPDLRGTQGTFTVFEEFGTDSKDDVTGGTRVKIAVRANRVRTQLEGPTLGGQRLSVPLVMDIDDDTRGGLIRVSGRKIRVRLGAYSDWVSIAFKSGQGPISGICRFLFVSAYPFRLYVTPINIDPEKPAMPVSWPTYYSMYLAKLHGPFATLGLAEDTWALNEGVLDEAAFLKQVYDIHRERKAMFFDALKRTRAGFCCCVFDLTDRIQHTFQRSQPVIEAAYCEADSLLGEVMKHVDDDTVLFVISDHGFAGFDRGIDLNAWLVQNGYMKLKPDSRGAEYLADVDWSATRAYSFGLAGIYLNVAGREGNGIVSNDGERRLLKCEIAKRLSELRDPATGGNAIHGVYDSVGIYSGPYVDNGPDLVVGYERGYRASWETAVGRTGGSEIFARNEKKWDGDHCIDSDLVPGTFLCNRKVHTEFRTPHIMDLAPTILEIFGIEKPAYMDGERLPAGSGYVSGGNL